MLIRSIYDVSVNFVCRLVVLSRISEKRSVVEIVFGCRDRATKGDFASFVLVSYVFVLF